MSLIIKITIARGRQALLLAALALCACKVPKPVSDGGVEDAGATRAEVLAQGGACIAAAAGEFQTAVVALENTLQAAPSPAALADARAAFHTAMDAWQVNEVMQVGPAAPSSKLGGADLRDQIYAWPLTSRCAIEETLVSKAYEGGVGAQLINRRTLYALEYLLFYEGAETACAASSPIVASGSWAALSANDRFARRWVYAGKVAADVRVHAEALVQAWSTGYLETVKSAGAAGNVYATQALALNAISDALFYVEHEVKDVKLARPTGVSALCGAPPCLDLLESQFGARSKANVRANLEGFRRLFQGCGADHAGVAFDDLLRGVGATALADKMLKGLDDADAALAAIEEPDFDAALTADLASVRAVHAAIKAATDVLKTEVMSVLDLEIPMALEGDTD